MDPVALDLRFRGHEVGWGPPDVAAFSRSAAAPTRVESVSIVPGRRPLSRGEPVVLFFQHAAYGIPAPTHDIALLDLSSWSVRGASFGYLASVPAARRTFAASRKAWVIAACLPWMIPVPMTASAAAPTEVQRPKKSRKKPPVPDPPPEPEVEAEPDADAEAEPDPDADDGDAADPDADETSASDPVPPFDSPPSDSPPPPAPSAGPFDSATLDAAWEGVDGFDVDIELKGGVRMRGRVGAVQRDTFTLIQHETGQVLVLPKSGVLSLRVYVPPPLPAKRGGGMIAGGSVLTSIGAPVFISGMVLLGITPSSVALHLPLLFIGGGALAAGIPMLVLGSRRRQAYQDALEARELSPVVFRTSHGWTGGLRFRF